MKKFIASLMTVVAVMGLFASESAVVNGVTWYYEKLTRWYDDAPYAVKIVKGGDSYSGNLTIPSELGDLPVTTIGDSAFSGCSGLTGIVILDTVTTIESSAFRDCTGLTEVSLPDSVECDYVWGGQHIRIFWLFGFAHGQAVGAHDGDSLRDVWKLLKSDDDCVA